MRLKTYYLTLSQVFPSTHKRAGKPTNFRAAFNNALMCARCQKHPKGMCMGECVVGHIKRHTLRANYEFWAKRFEKIAAGEAVLSVREWVGKPYAKGSTQREIALLTREDGIGIEKIWFDRANLYCPMVATDKFNFSQVPLHIANNDGLDFDDWFEWFKGYDLTKPMAIIHFTYFRYCQ